VSRPDKDMGAAEFLVHADRAFRIAAEKWLIGDEKFTAKLHPAYAPYGDYDQLMRLEEWYGRQ
jgi:ATP-dependent helicase/nuclease subunit B